MLRLALPAAAAVVLCLFFSSTSLAQEPAAAVTAADVKAAADAAASAKTTGNTAWIIMATGLVFLMMPGLALFYGGMVRRKNVLGTMMHTFIALGIVGVQWVVIGYCLAFGESQGGFIGWSPELILLSPEMASKTFPGLDTPVYLHAMFQGMFAIITAALISGAFAERVKFGAFCLFILLWTTIVYDPLAHWVWSFTWIADESGVYAASGWLGAMGALDFAGGTVVHIAAGFGGLGAILVLRKRFGYPEHSFHPNSMVLTLLGAGLLWFGWFGFNAGSALGASGQAVSALTVTQIAAASAGLAWVVTEWCVKGKPTALGFASGVVAGLVAITPASGFVAPGGALIIGMAAGVLCYGMVLLKPMLGYDDSLDAFGIHGVGGFLGAVMTGFLVSIPVWVAGTGLSEDKFIGKLTEGKWDMMAQVQVQLIACLAAAAFSFVISAVLAITIEKTIGFTLPEEEETLGMDRAIHGEVGFDYGGGALEELPGTAVPEPKPAMAPPNGALSKRFTVVVEGADSKELLKVWSDLCQPKEAAPSPSFTAVYPHLTTVSGNKFRFRGGDPGRLGGELQKLFTDALGMPVKTHVES